MTKRAADAEKTKQRILRVAFRLFASKGYKNVSVDEIVKRARSSKGAFYNHFPSKDLLIYEYIKQKDERYEALTQELDLIPTSVGKLRFFASNLFAMLAESPELSATLLTMDINNPQVSAMFLDTNRYLYKLLDPIFERGKASGEIKSEIGVHELAESFLTVTTGVEARWCIRKSSFDIVTYGLKVVDIFLAGLTCDSSHPVV